MPLSQSYRLHADQEIIFNAAEHYLTIGGERHHLEPLQSRMLMFFVEYNGQVVNTREIANGVWERKEVSDNLVRQVISLLRTQLCDTNRPYNIIKTIPKQGYLFDVETSEIVVDRAIATSCVKKKSGKTLPVVAVALILSLMLISATYLMMEDSKQSPQLVTQNSGQYIVPVIFNEIALDHSSDYEMAKSVYEYIYFGLNSSKNIVGYRGEYLETRDQIKVSEQGYKLKSWLKSENSGYKINLNLQFIKNNKTQIVKFEKKFTSDDFFSPIGDLILEVKTYILPDQTDYNISNHRITSIESYDDWKIIAQGISLFYQGKGAKDLLEMEESLNNLKKEGRSYYLLDSLNSYISTMKFLNDKKEKDRDLALQLAEAAFEQNPRCNISNTTLGMALLLNNEIEKAYPYLFFAAESSPSPLNYYLLGVADEQADNPKGAEYNYQRFSALDRAGIGQVKDLQTYLQNPNLSKPITK